MILSFMILSPLLRALLLNILPGSRKNSTLAP